MAMFLYILNQSVILDDEDYTKVAGMKWHIGKNGYAMSTKYVRGSGRKNQKNTHIYLHRLIANAPKGRVVDHINGNKLDNRKENLRVCTQRENMVNCGMLKNNTSGVKGVAWHKQAKKWESYIHFANKKISLGFYDDIKEATEKRREGFNKYFGYIERGNYV